MLLLTLDFDTYAAAIENTMVHIEIMLLVEPDIKDLKMRQII